MESASPGPRTAGPPRFKESRPVLRPGGARGKRNRSVRGGFFPSPRTGKQGREHDDGGRAGLGDRTHAARTPSATHAAGGEERAGLVPDVRVNDRDVVIDADL